MKKYISIFGLMLLSVSSYSQPSIKEAILGKDKTSEVIASMTQEEKIRLMMGLGNYIWYNPPTGEKTVLLEGAAGCTYSIPRLGITPAVLTDGPAGLRIDAQPKDTTQTFYCTAFPTATALASSWNTELLEAVGKAMGNEVLEYGSDVLLAPAINIHRNPLCGRNFEYYSEDPLVAGKMGAAMIRGLQSNGIGTSLKHFAANNFETNRLTANTVISQRALREIYLKGFEIAVKESKPWTVMSSYNRLNGFYTSENVDLLTTILRKEWGFQGLVMSDWGGGTDAIAQMQAGNDLLMPGDYQYEELISALKNKLLDMRVIDHNLVNILNFIEKTPRFKGYKPPRNPNLATHATVSRQAATECIVLLKNDRNTLPFIKIKRVALFGKASYRYIAGGTGSGEVNYEKAISIKDGFENGGYNVKPELEKIYTHFIDTVVANSKEKVKKYVVDFHPELSLDKTLIEKQVKNSDVAVITIGRNAGEGGDRTVSDFSLTDTEKLLIKNVSEAYHAAGKKVVVILNIGGVIATADWRNWPDAILLAWQTGQEGGNALIDILKGNVNPSGKLPMSFPMKYEDVPSANSFPGEPKENPVNATYDEGIYVGYRYYDSFAIPVAYEFGYGLSYTTFEYSEIKISNPVFSNNVEARITIKNIGKVAGKEVVQLYLSAPQDEMEKPSHELKAFAKTRLLQPGEEQQITFTLDARSLASFWSGYSVWMAEKGSYEIGIGASSRDIRQKIAFLLPETIVVEQCHNVLYPNRKIKELSVSSKDSNQTK